MAIYIVIYMMIIAFSLLLQRYNNSKQSRRIFLFLSFGIMTIVLGLRGSQVGEDTQHYIDIFNYADNVKWSSLFSSLQMRTVYFIDRYGYADTIEDGFLVLCKIVHLFTNNPQIFLFLIAAGSLSLYAKFIYDNTEHVFFATYIFLTESLFMLSFNGIRQLLAGAIALQAYTALRNKQLIKAIVFIAFAALIHNVALITVVLIPLFYIKGNKESGKFKYLMLATVLSPIIVVLASDILCRFFPRYAGYFVQNFWTNKIGGTAIMWVLEFFLVYYLYLKQFPGNQLFMISCLTMLYLVLEFTGFRITMFSRVGWFFRPYLMLLIPEGITCFKVKNRKWIRLLFYILLLMLYISYAKTPARNYYFC